MTGLTRPRIDDRLASVWDHGLGLVVAPAGSGKTTLLARFAAASPDPVAWYRAEGRDESEAALLQHLEAAFAAVVPRVARGWTSAEAASSALERAGAGRLLLVVDDLHLLESTPAEAALERFIDYCPPSVAMLVGSRAEPGFNLSRRRVSGGLLEIGPDDLRFRSWEVERLFRDYYEVAVGPEEIARLARRTEGWAAGLQLFHLATIGKSPDERRRVLAGLGSSSRMVREYLTRNVLAELPPELREFLVDTCVLGLLSGPLCDRLLGRSDSARILAELERRRVFTIALDDDGTYRYHEVLRGHLEGVLLEEQGEAAVRAAHLRAGALLEASGALPEALVAYGRAEAWDAAGLLLSREGRQLADRSAPWLDVLPAATMRHDPWLVLAAARRHRAEGRWPEAVEAYQRAELAFGAAVSAQACRRERLAIVPWLDATSSPTTDWSGRLRSAVGRDPLAIARELAVDDQGRDERPAGRARVRLAEGLALLAGGRVGAALYRLDPEPAEEEMEPSVSGATFLARGAARLLAADRRGIIDLETGIARAEAAGWGWFARLGRTLLAAATASTFSVPAGGDADPWTSGLGLLLRAWLRPDEPGAPTGLAGAAARFADLGSPALEGWALAIRALSLARSGSNEAGEAIARADGAVRRGAIPEARLLIEAALARTDPERAAAHLARSAEIAARTGLVLAPVEPGSVAPPRPTEVPASAATRDEARAARPARGTAIAIDLLGGFALRIDGVEVDLAAVKPRARLVLHLLGMSTGAPVHREGLLAALWPDTDPETAARLLHVAISGLRAVLEPGSARGGDGLIRREGDAYRLRLPPGSEIDLAVFEALLAAATASQAGGDDAAAADCLKQALERYRGDLLPEDGPAEWVVDARDRTRLAAVGAARTLAELRLRAADHADAVRACLRGLTIDRYDDALWRLLVEAHDRAGDRIAAHRARRGYEQMLGELGIDTPAEAARMVPVAAYSVTSAPTGA